MNKIEEVADVVLYGKNMFSSLKDGINEGFVALKGNKILKVGKLDEMEHYVNETTQCIDCKDGLIMPGFHDCHVHVIDGGLFSKGLQIGESKSEEEAAQMVKEYANEHSELPWIIGFGWYHIYWEGGAYPTKKSLDAVLPNRPIFLQNEDGHGAWVNSKALEMCNITKDTPDPEFGTIFRDENGEPTGYLDELAMMLCAHEAYKLPLDYEMNLLKDFMVEANKNGVTSVNDMRPLFDMDLGNLQNYEEIDKDGNQSVRINFSTNLFNDINDAVELKNKYNGGKLHYAGLKQFIDGVAIPYTAVLVDDYSDKPDWKGEPILDVNQLEDAIVVAHENDIPVHLHAAGDGSVRIALDAYEKAIKSKGVKDIRHSIEHNDNVHPDDINRFKELGVVASMQPEHMAPTDNFDENPYIQRLGEERSKLTWPIGTLMRTGADVAFGTDYPVVGFNPMNGIYRAVSRRHDDGMPVEGWNPIEKVSVLEALHAYTYGSARMVKREQELGTLEEGKLADITVLKRDLSQIDIEEIRDVEVSLVICDGKIVYQG